MNSQQEVYDEGRLVVVSIDPDPDHIHRRLIGVRVRSRMKPHIKKVVQLDPGNFSTPNDLMHAIKIAAASCAEQLGEDCGDRISPEECYRLAEDEATEAFMRHGEMIKAARSLQ